MFPMKCFNNSLQKLMVAGLLVLATAASGSAQSLKIKSSSARKLKITAYGLNKEGKRCSAELNDVELGYWKTLSLYKMKFGYDLYNNQNMEKSGADVSNRWTTMTIEDKETGAKDEVDLTREIDEVKLKTTKLWLRVRQQFDYDYQLTTVSLFDKHK